MDHFEIFMISIHDESLLCSIYSILNRNFISLSAVPLSLYLSMHCHLYLLCLYPSISINLSPSLSVFLSLKVYMCILVITIFSPKYCRRFRDQTKKIKDMEVQRKRLEADLLNRSLTVLTRMSGNLRTSRRSP